MSKARPRQSMPPGLKSQIAFAVILTICAVVVLPTALSANHDALKVEHEPVIRSAGKVATSVQAFTPANFASSAFSDWDAAPH